MYSLSPVPLWVQKREPTRLDLKVSIVGILEVGMAENVLRNLESWTMGPLILTGSSFLPYSSVGKDSPAALAPA